MQSIRFVYSVLYLLVSYLSLSLQISDEEKFLILEYENYLASSDKGEKITESNSYLLNQVTILNPHDNARKLLTSVVELIKAVNKSLKLGQLLCRCRDPDFLLDIIHHQVIIIFSTCY